MATRQRKVFPRETVAHLWAHKGQDQARDSADTFYFYGPTLYSYGRHFVIAHILSDECGPDLAGRVLWNDATYSNTTSKHQTIAWRALTRQQTDKRLHLPSMGEDSARGIDRALKEKRLPEMAETLLEEIRGAVAATAGKRHGSGPFIDCLFRARKYEFVARAFYARAGKRYPLPLVPESNDDIPADKTARNAWILTFARVLIEASYKREIALACNYLAQSIEAAANDPHATGQAYTDARTRARIAASTYSVAERCEKHAHTAQGEYSKLHAGKKSAAVVRILKQITPLTAQFKAASDAAHSAQERAEFAADVRMFYLEEYRNRINKKRGNWIVTRKSGDNLPAYLQRVGIEPDSMLGIAGKRIAALARADAIERACHTVIHALNTGNDYFDNGNPAAGKFADAASHYRRAFSNIEHNRLDTSKHAQYLLRNVRGQLIEARARLDTIAELIARENAQRIKAWISGQSNVRPAYEAGTFARIKGNLIETTRGASVPIAHACRLARVFDRVVNAGGKQWADGAGPMVGHYRVNSIGADGSMIIGCHEFNPTEARRLRDILAQCAECAEVTESADSVA